jgi:hypothetical protein
MAGDFEKNHLRRDDGKKSAAGDSYHDARSDRGRCPIKEKAPIQNRVGWRGQGRLSANPPWLGVRGQSPPCASLRFPSIGRNAPEGIDL